MIDRIEALADAIAHLNDWHNPASRAYQLRNPLLLRAYALLHVQEADADGFRVFNSQVAGWRAGLHDLRIKLGGKSRATLAKPTLTYLLRAYEQTRQCDVRRAVDFMKVALDWYDADDPIRADMPIEWFLHTPTKSLDVPVTEGESLGGR